MRRILVVDDEPKILRLIEGLLEDAGYDVTTCGDGDSARELLSGGIFDLLVTDVRLPDCSGVDILAFARKAIPGLPVILITAYGTVTEAVRAMKLGAVDYLQKPFDMETLGALVDRALDTAGLREEIAVLRSDERRRKGVRQITGESAAIRRVRAEIERVAPTPSTVLIQGESGTGKELVAEMIHRLGPAPCRPLIKVNCLAIPSELMESELFGHVKGAFTGADQSRKGWFELANGGTLFLDEIADLPAALQGKLLRVLEDHRITPVGARREIPVQVRLLAATNVPLKERVAEGRFREDLFYRLNVFPVTMPPLRERPEDLPLLSRALLETLASRHGRPVSVIDPAVFDVLGGYAWPGNVRELRNVLERAIVLAGAGPVGVDHLPQELLEGGVGEVATGEGFRAEVETFKAELLRRTLRESGGVKKEAARRLGLSQRAFSHYVSRYGLDEGV